MAREPTHFINVDLEIRSRSRLDVLTAELGRELHEMYVGKIGRLHAAHYEVFARPHTPDALIRGFLRCLARSSPAARRVWRSARTRDFNVGIQAGTTPHSFELVLAPDTVKLVAAAGARVLVTVYAPEVAKAPPKRTGAR